MDYITEDRVDSTLLKSALNRSSLVVSVEQSFTPNSTRLLYALLKAYSRLKF